MKRKLLSLLLVVVMILAMGSTAFAAQGTNTNSGDGSITITGTTADKTYDIYRIFDLKVNASKTAYSYTVNKDWEGFFFGGAGASYLTEKAAAAAGDKVLTHNGKQYVINLTDATAPELAQKALSYATKLTNNDGSKKATGTSLKFTGLKLGYYLVYPQGAADIKEGYGSICSLTSTDKDATAVQKATYPNIEKAASASNNDGADIGDTISYTITGQVPDTTGFVQYTWKVSDKMSAGLTFNSAVANLKVKFGDTNITVPDGLKASLSIKDNGFVLNFDMTKYQSYVGKTITITYDAVVNADAVTAKTTNEAVLEYSNDPDDSLSTEPVKDNPNPVPTWSNIVSVDKVNKETARLAGAKFVLMNSEGKFYKQTVDGAGKITKVEWISVSGASNLSANKTTVNAADITALTASGATVMTTDAAGAAAFKGIADGTYYLVEIEAPEGYNLPTSCISATVAGAVPEGATDGLKVGANKTAQVVNTSGTTLPLPSTGGMGTVLFYLLGALLVAGSAIVLFARRRMNARG